MNLNQRTVPVVIPPALDADESELAARNEFLAERELVGADSLDELANADETADEIILDENDAAPGGASDEREAKNLRRAKRRKSLAFLTVFGAGFGVFLVFLAWAFGFGFFAPAKRISVDRNQKSNGVNSSSSATNDDEKLKTALALVAGDAGNNQNSPLVSDASTDPNALPEQNLKLTSGDKTGEQTNQNNLPSGNMIVLPDETRSVKSNGAQNQIRSASPLSQGLINTMPNLLASEVQPSSALLQSKSKNNGGANLSDKSDGAIARSVFFGSVFDKNNSFREDSPNNSSNFSARRKSSSNESANVPAFGTLLPVRLLGAVYTLRGAGGLVRMELVRTVKKGAFSYPAGTIIVGRLRGSEFNRAFITATGAIDPKSGKLLKFEGEILGVDGASGVEGNRRAIKSWGARFLSGLREAGGQAVNVLAARGGRGGTIVLSGTGGLGKEASSIVRGDSQENSFVVVRAGTEAYVLITDLPAEQRGDDSDELEKLAGGTNGQLPGINLTEPEMAEILSTDDPNKIRAALLKMSPELRALAIKAIEEGK